MDRSSSAQGGGAVLLPLVRNYKAHADLASVDAHKFAPAECQPGRRQHQKEFLRAQDIERPFDFQSRAGGRNVEHDAASAPRAVDAHQVHRVAVFESNAFRFPVAVGHQPASATATSPSRRNFNAKSLIEPKRIIRWAAERLRDSNAVSACFTSLSESLA